jgi:hypothetical protein
MRILGTSAAIQATERRCRKVGTLVILKIYLLFVICSNDVTDVLVLPYIILHNIVIMVVVKELIMHPVGDVMTIEMSPLSRRHVSAQTSFRISCP